MESFAPILKAMVAEKETESSIPVLEVIAPEKGVKPSVLASDAIALEAKVLGQEDTVVLTIESVISISKESVGPLAEDPLLEESMAPEVEVDIPPASPEMTAPIVVVDEQSVPIVGSLMEPTQPSPLLAIAQGSYRPRRFFPPLYIYPIEFSRSVTLFMVFVRSCVSC